MLHSRNLLAASNITRSRFSSRNTMDSLFKDCLNLYHAAGLSNKTSFLLYVYSDDADIYLIQACDYAIWVTRLWVLHLQWNVEYKTYNLYIPQGCVVQNSICGIIIISHPCKRCRLVYIPRSIIFCGITLGLWRWEIVDSTTIKTSILIYWVCVFGRQAHLFVMSVLFVWCCHFGCQASSVSPAIH